jgi:hypothetical protein
MISSSDFRRFLARETFDVRHRQLGDVHRFINVGWIDNVRNADQIQQLASAR